MIHGRVAASPQRPGKRFENQNDYAKASHRALSCAARRGTGRRPGRRGHRPGRVAENYLSVGNNAQALAYALKTLAAHEALGDKVGEASF